MSNALYSITKLATAKYTLVTKDGIEKFRSEKQAKIRREALQKADADAIAKAAAVKKTAKPKGETFAKKDAEMLARGPKAGEVKAETVGGQLIGFVSVTAPVRRGDLVGKAMENLKPSGGATVNRNYIQSYISWMLRNGMLVAAK